MKYPLAHAVKSGLDSPTLTMNSNPDNTRVLQLLELHTEALHQLLQRSAFLSAAINVISEEQLMAGDDGDFEERRNRHYAARKALADSDEAAISLLHKLGTALGRTEKNGG